MRMVEKRNVAKKEEKEKKVKLAHEGKHNDSLTNFVIFLEGFIYVFLGKLDRRPCFNDFFFKAIHATLGGKIKTDRRLETYICLVNTMTLIRSYSFSKVYGEEFHDILIVIYHGKRNTQTYW